VAMAHPAGSLHSARNPGQESGLRATPTCSMSAVGSPTLAKMLGTRKLAGWFNT
jgi:hypothetical protein